MCGIAGLAGSPGRADTQPLLDGMAASMHHRGPDDQRVIQTGNGSGLCACRLAIQDPSGLGAQPMRSPASGRWVALNGEIYNVAPLRDRLRGLGHDFRSSGDTEVVLAAYDEWGPSCVDHLRGMFAIAVWDEPEGRMFLARDRLGIKPLYVARLAGGGIAFASELRTLLGSGLIAPRLDVDGLRSFLALGAVQEPLTMVQDVEMLPPGSTALWRDGRLQIREYWSLAGAFANQAQMDRDAATRALRRALEEAVGQHLVSDRPLGVFLSGGIDSSALVGLVSTVAGAPPHTVSVTFPQQELSEEPFIRQVSERYGTDHTAIHVDEPALLSEVPAAVDAMDQPSMDGVNTFIVSRGARRAGLTVALSGLGGDELFGGYPSFVDVPRLNRIRRAVPGPAGRLAAPLVQRVGRGSDRYDKLARWLTAAEPSPHAYALRREFFGHDATSRLLGGDERGSHWALPASLSDELNTVSAMELSVYMKNVLLRDSDVMSMAHSLEIRVPFLDHEVVELAAGLPGAWKTPSPRAKPLLVDAVADLLPAAVVDRRKMGFTLPFDAWMRGPLRAEVERVLLDGDHGGAIAGALDPDAVRGMWRRFESGQAVWHRAWGLYVLKVWGERHLSGAAPLTRAA